MCNKRSLARHMYLSGEQARGAGQGCIDSMANCIIIKHPTEMKALQFFAMQYAIDYSNNKNMLTTAKVC